MKKPVIITLVVMASVVACIGYLHGWWPSATKCRLHVAQPVLAENLRQHVHVLAEDIGERHHELPEALHRAAEYIHAEFTASGLQTADQYYGDNFRNVLATPGHGRAQQQDVIVVGAHYDTVWLSPGADDNASGVAVLLELGRLLMPLQLAGKIQLVAFTNEEQPFAETEQMGSRVYVKHLLSESVSVSAMYSLEMLGYYSNKPGSQQYPPPLDLVYPDTGNFAALVANLPSAALLFQALPSFRRHSGFPVQGLVMSEQLVPDIRRSDHAQFWDAGIPALMLTDTADFRNPRYHTVGDLPHSLDYPAMAGLTRGLACMLAEQAGVAWTD